MSLSWYKPLRLRGHCKTNKNKNNPLAWNTLSCIVKSRLAIAGLCSMLISSLLQRPLSVSLLWNLLEYIPYINSDAHEFCLIFNLNNVNQFYTSLHHQYLILFPLDPWFLFSALSPPPLPLPLPPPFRTNSWCFFSRFSSGFFPLNFLSLPRAPGHFTSAQIFITPDLPKSCKCLYFMPGRRIPLLEIPFPSF